MSIVSGKRGSSGWLLVIVLGILSFAVMSLVLVWINIERMDTSYFINAIQADIRDRQALKAKLEVEREHLLSPYELGRRAEKFNMHPPLPGQVRRMEEQ